ncbi:hypothetical protein D3C84_1019680 [compost metagenome]
MAHAPLFHIREDGTGAAEITDVWRMRHSYRIREVEPDALSTATTVFVKMGLWQAETP